MQQERRPLRTVAALLAIAGVLGLPSAAQPPSRVPANCDRRCLEALVDEQRGVVWSDAVFDLGGSSGR